MELTEKIRRDIRRIYARTLREIENRITCRVSEEFARIEQHPLVQQPPSDSLKKWKYELFQIVNHGKPVVEQFKTVKPIPRYYFWAPVKTSFYAGNGMPHPPYIPYIGDSKEDHVLAMNCYKSRLVLFSIGGVQ